MSKETYCTEYLLLHLKECLYRWHVNKLFHTYMHSCLPKGEPLGLKHVEDVVKIKILLQQRAFCWFMLCDYMIYCHHVAVSTSCVCQTMRATNNLNEHYYLQSVKAQKALEWY